MKINDTRKSPVTKYEVGQVICTDGSFYLIAKNTISSRFSMIDLEDGEEVSHANSLEELYANSKDDGDELVNAEVVITGVHNHG